MPLVSVVIPVYNMQEYVEKCISSVAEQTLKDIEIICINDGSTDESPKILDKMKKLDSRLVVVHQENIGAGMTRNRGINMARGQYIAFMDPDDYYPDNDVLKDLFYAAENHNVQVAGGSFCEDHDGKIAYNYPPALQDYIFKEDRIMSYKEHQFDFGYIRFIYARNLLLDNNIRFPYYSRFQDPPFFVRAMVHAKEFYALKRFAYCYRWGHKTIDWNTKRTNDMVRGILDNIVISRDEQLGKLHKLSVSRIEKGGLDAICNNLNSNNLELFHLLMQVNQNIDVSLLNEENKVEGIYILKPLKWLLEKNNTNLINEMMIELEQKEKEIEHIQNSWSYRIGRMVTAPMRWLRRSLR